MKGKSKVLFYLIIYIFYLSVFRLHYDRRGQSSPLVAPTRSARPPDSDQHGYRGGAGHHRQPQDWQSPGQSGQMITDKDILWNVEFWKMD